MDSTLIAEAQVKAKILLEEQIEEVGTDEIVAVGLDEDRAVFVGSHPLHVVMTATYNLATGEYDDWTDATASDLAAVARILTAHALSDRAKRVF